VAGGGFGSLGPGVWVSPHPECAAEAIGVLCEAGVAEGARGFTATRLGLGNARVMVAAAGELTVIEEEYRRFLEAFGPRAPGGTS
jgi:phenylacetic acid degradation operon negative regulatory protein